MEMKKLVTAGGVVGLPLVFLAGIISSHTLCACMSLEESLTSSIGASPRTDPNAFSARLLKILPPGSTTDNIYLVLDAASRGRSLAPDDIADLRKESESVDVDGQTMYGKDMASIKRRCVAAPGKLKCHFMLEKNWFELNEVGFDLHVMLDGADRLKGVRASPYSVWGSSGT